MSKLGAISDAGAASWSLAKHVMGGAAIGAGVNSVAYANGASLTNSQSFGQAALSGAAWGAAAGGITGTAAFRKNMTASAAMRRTAAIDKNLAEQAGQPFVGPPTRMQATGSKIGYTFGKIRHTAGDMATSLYGNMKALTPAGRRSKIEKEGMLRDQANKIIDQNVRNMDMHTAHVQQFRNGEGKFSEYESPAYMRKGSRRVFGPTSGDQMTLGIGGQGNEQMNLFGSTAQRLEQSQAKNVAASNYRQHVAFGGNQKSLGLDNGMSQGDLFI